MKFSNEHMPKSDDNLLGNNLNQTILPATVSYAHWSQKHLLLYHL